MRVYHGSYTAISEIDLEKCEPKRDFGQGFYVTKYREQAENWAVRKGIRNCTTCIITEFEFDEDVYFDNNAKVLRFDDYNDDWFDFVVQNRQKQHITHDYDIIEGPVADDKIQNRIQRFLEGKMTRADFFTQLIYPNPSHQICFCTVSSLQYLKMQEHSIIFDVEDIVEKIVESLVLDFNKTEKDAASTIYSSETFGQLANAETQLYKKTWQEIYEMLKNEISK
jgi:hypothetical protein